MTDKKTLAQSRLRKLQDNLKDKRKNQKSSSSDLTSRGLQHLSDSHKMVFRKPSLSQRPTFSPAKERQLNILDSFLAKTAKQLMKRPVLPTTSLPLNSGNDSISFKIGREKYLQPNTSNQNNVTKKRLIKSPTQQNRSSSGPVTQPDSERFPFHEYSKGQHSKDIPGCAMQERLRRDKQSNRNGGTERQANIPQSPPEKRKLDDENLDKTKITKTKRAEDSSKKLSSVKNRPEKKKGSETNTFKNKISSILNSYKRDKEIMNKESSSILNSYKRDKEIINKESSSILNSYNREKEMMNKEPSSILNSYKRDKETINKESSSILNSYKCDKEVMSKESKLPIVKVQVENSSTSRSISAKSSEKCINFDVLLKESKVRKEVYGLSDHHRTKVQARLEKILNRQKQKDRSKDSSLNNDFNEHVHKSSSSHFIESMDWEPSNDEILRSIREEVDPSRELMDWQDICDIEDKPCEGMLYIVVDTNVLLQNIFLLTRLSKSTLRGFKTTLLIPWQVLKELDDLKTKVDYKKVNVSARRAIKFLSKATTEHQTNIAFQTQAKHFEPTQFVVEVPDDHLIKCCFQLKSKNQKVILLSNDINLRVKSVTNNIQAVDDNWILKTLNQEAPLTTHDSYCFEKEPKECETTALKAMCSGLIYKTTNILKAFLSDVIAIKYKEKYEDLWLLWVPIGKYLPKTFEFMTSDPSFEPSKADLDSLDNFYKTNSSYNKIEPKDVEWLGRKCISLARCMNNFIPNEITLTFLKDLSFLKTSEGRSSYDITYIEGSYMLAEKYFKDTEGSLNEFVAYINDLYSEKGSLLKQSEDILHHIDVNLELIYQFRDAIMKFQEIHGEIPLGCDTAVTLHKALCNFLGKKIDDPVFPYFSPEDIVEFVNHNRSVFTPVINWLTNQEFSLKQIRSRIM